jgi:hypothetical protein
MVIHMLVMIMMRVHRLCVAGWQGQGLMSGLGLAPDAASKAAAAVWVIPSVHVN